ncbi:hypothetical protein CPB83DRAFT_909896 [Crepidotus variabilis]|uniref:AB hydrolase-1 domain-containing protein n=1 Tax=Crepidotus variabilis TaxID=179855 RepID=A0A9P6E8G2_9AGAR|nr:hypothetical protein CPB83DRAFT_909896 [Crepidotus variabilis]
MIGNSFIDYVNIRISIAGLRLVAPLSVVYLCTCAVAPAVFFLPVAIYASLEATFYLLVYLPRRARLQAPPTHPPPTLNREQRAKLFERCLLAGTSDNTVDSPYPNGWFLPKNSKPKREDVIDWLLWALFSSSRELAGATEYAEELDGYLEQIESSLGEKFEPGHSGSEGVASMRVNLDPVIMLHRPLCWYFIVGVVDAYTSIMLGSLGFKHFALADSQWTRTFPPRPLLWLLSSPAPDGVAFPYWHRPHKSQSKTPLVFFHGIGIGLFPYLSFFSTISKADPDVGILLPELMSICMHMTPRSVPPRPLLLASLNTVLESLDQKPLEDLRPETQPLLSNNSTAVDYQSISNRSQGWSQVVLVGHSYGTFISGWILRQLIDLDTLEQSTGSTFAENLASRISHTILIDPIPILLSNPTVAHNFLYREPSTVCPRRLGSHSDLLLDEETASTSPPPKPTKMSPSYFSSAAAWQLWYFASRDADIARTLFRTFFWTEGGIWREEIAAFMAGSSRKHNMTVFLGGLDQVIPAEGIRRYLTRQDRWSERWSGQVDQHDGQLDIVESLREGGTRTASEDGGILDVFFNPKLDHAVLFDDARWTVPLVEVVQRYIRTEL